MSYHRFTDHNGAEFGSFEVYRVRRADRWRDDDGRLARCGFYWQACFPGCLPDGDPMGPFRSEAAAIRDAQEACS